jgi:ABC-type dipeptide/oligopeptide/nickel transport system permease component
MSFMLIILAVLGILILGIIAGVMASLKNKDKKDD